MKRLNELYDCSYDTEISGITTNSKNVNKGDLFVCIKGVLVDRHDFIEEAVKNGASALITSKDVETTVPFIKVDDTNKELPIVCKKFYDIDQINIDLIGVTGTDGKTTVSTIIKELLGDTCAYMGTSGMSYKNSFKETSNTTPDIDVICKFLKEIYDNGCNCLSFEASSEAFYRHRIDSLRYDYGILTNISEDHLNVHKTFENYLECKSELFKNIKKDGYAILNKDDKYFEYIKDKCKCNVLTYGKLDADLIIKSISVSSDSTSAQLSYHGTDFNIKTKLLGEFNIYNLAASILVLITKNYQINEIINMISNINPVKGRLESIDFGQDYKIIIDYAHTTNAIFNVLSFMKKVKRNNSRIITVVGSAGGREKEKRGPMGKVSLELSDYVIFTSDDPRNENVDDIINDLVSISNSNNYIRILDRAKAIKYALDMAKKDDIVMLLGKGGDKGMFVGNELIHYSDYEEVLKYFNKNN